MKKLRIIVGGYIGLLTAGGVTWDYLQYPLGFSLLGHDVYYIEDTRLYPVYQNSEEDWNDATYNVTHLKTVMETFGFKGRWAYRDEASGNCYGLTESNIKVICKTADVFVNISCSTYLRDEYLQIPVRVLIDSDPMFTQIQYLSQQMFTPGEAGLQTLIKEHNYLFTFGENIGTAECRIPDCGLRWLTTRQPVCIDYWRVDAISELSGNSFTTLMNWTAGKILTFEGEEWGQKDIEFQKFVKLPQLVNGIKLSAIVNKTGGTGQNFFKDEIEKEGWIILNADKNANNWKDYQNFILGSLGEFSVAKNTYVKGNTGWFSCRSACYLASGKPVVTQDTGWSKNIPSGNGLFAYSNIETAEQALQMIVADYKFHTHKARELAAEFFDSNKILKSLLEQIGFN